MAFSALHSSNHLSFSYFSSSTLFSSMELNERRPIIISLFLAFSLSFLLFFFVSLYKKRRKQQEKSTQNSISLLKCSTNKTHQKHPLFVEILTSNQTPKWDAVDSHFSPLLDDDGLDGSKENEYNLNGSELEMDAGDCGDVAEEECEKSGDSRGKKKKKRGKKRRHNSRVEEEGYVGNNERTLGVKKVVDCLYPFTSSASATQRKIRQHYDQLVKSNDAKALTLAQVGQFANCLIEARNELQHKSEIIQRKFTITKALLFKADRSSFDRLCQQIYKLETEQKRLEEDAIVYNRLQEQLKLSPAYKKMLEIGSRMELEASSAQFVENEEAEFAEISFEELLAQEKKDSFWQRNGKLRTCTS